MGVTQYLAGRAASFRWAARGVAAAWRTQANFRIHIVAAAGVVCAGCFCGLTRMEWCAVASAVALVLVAELVNTAIEAAVDLVSPEQHPLAALAKDCAAGAVLVAAGYAVAVGCLVLVPCVAALWD